MSSEKSSSGNSSGVPDTKVEITGGELDVKEESGFYTAYSGFASNLRIWFIAYGIGAPVVLLSNETAWSTVVDSGLGKRLAYFYFIGVAVQIFAALIYKTAMWYLYIGELKKSFRKSLLIKSLTICQKTI